MYDIVGVGLGPANLSLACLLASGEPQQKGLTSTFLEQGAVIDWHQGQTVLGSTTLSEFFFDLVTPVDPTSRFSFLNFLKENGRLERFLDALIMRPSRAEFNEYLNWSAKQIDSVHWSCLADSVTYRDDMGCFEVLMNCPHCGRTRVLGRNVSVGIGCQQKSIDGDELEGVVDALSYVEWRRKDVPDDTRKIAVIGDGQSAAEIVHDLLSTPTVGSSISWVTPRMYPSDLRQDTFYLRLFLDQGIQEYFDKQKVAEVAGRGQWGLTAGVDPELSREIAKLAYENEREGRTTLRFVPLSRVALISRNEGEKLELKDNNGNFIGESFDIAIKSIGREGHLEALQRLLSNHLQKEVAERDATNDYLIPVGERGANLILQSMNHGTHGETDGNFATAPIRNKRVLEKLGCRDETF